MAAEEEITTLRAAKEELSSNLEDEKATVKSLKEANTKEKGESFQKGFKKGAPRRSRNFWVLRSSTIRSSSAGGF